MITAKKVVKTVLPRRALNLLRYCWYHYQVRRLTRIEASGPRAEPPMPPPVLRYRVHGGLDRSQFDEVGRTCAENVREALAATGHSLEEFRSVLDFACGCGRVMRHLAGRGAPSGKFHGSDIDAEAIEWNRQHLGHLATWAVNGPDPPTGYASGQFDLVICISLLTHLDEPSQFAWLAELQRILLPGGMILLTFHGPFCHGDLSWRERKTLETSGILYKRFWSGNMKLDGLPESYQLAYHTPDYVRERWGEYFDIVRYTPRGINDHQDLIQMRRRSDRARVQAT